MIEPTGKLDLTFRRKQSGITYIAKQYYKLPLQILTPFYQDDDGTAFLYLLNTSEGIFHNDRLVTNVTVENRSKVLLTTTSATKLYKMNDGHAKIQNHFDVGEEGVLEYLPECSIPFAKSKTYQESTFHLTKSSFLIAADMVTPGRIDRGEAFEYDIYSSKIKIYVDGELLAFEKLNIRPREMNLSGIGMMENYKNYASIYIYTEMFPEELLESINQIIHSSEGMIGGVSRIHSSLAAVKILGNSTVDMQKVMDTVWDMVRRNILGKPGVRVRKY